MKIVNKNDRNKVIEILYKSFENILIPTSINFVVGYGKKRKSKLRHLFSYQVDRAFLEGKVILSNDDKGCILFLYRKKYSLKRLFLEAKLLINCIGIKNIFNVLRRENILKHNHPQEDFIHLWLMGVIPEEQGKSIGPRLLKETMDFYHKKSIYVETTTQINLEFYKKNGFLVFQQNHELDYPIFFLKRENV